MYLVTFSTINVCIYHMLAIGHLMQAWAWFVLLLFIVYCSFNWLYVIYRIYANTTVDQKIISKFTFVGLDS